MFDGVLICVRYKSQRVVISCKFICSSFKRNQLSVILFSFLSLLKSFTLEQVLFMRICNASFSCLQECSKTKGGVVYLGIGKEIKRIMYKTA
jgi:hypothetical protein